MLILHIFEQLKKMDQNVIQTVADHYVSDYGLMDRLSDLKELIKNHSVELFYIFHYILLVKNYLICLKKHCLHSRDP